MEISGARQLVSCLEHEGVEIIFGYPGAANSPIYDELSHSKIKHILTRSEQGAAHAASGYARVSGRVGVCMATSGPGATNLITGIATAYMDSISMVAITGQVARELIGKDAFQEVDITGATAPFCKHNYLVKKLSDLPRIIHEAFYIAISGRHGPVLIDIPVDLQNEKSELVTTHKIDVLGYKPVLNGAKAQISLAVGAIAASQRPVIIAGGGIISSHSSSLLDKFAASCNIPIVNTLMGIGSVTSDNPLLLGLLGSHGVYAANYCTNHADLWIVLGARLADRTLALALERNINIIHVDIDPAELGKNKDVFIPIIGDVKRALRQFMSEMKNTGIDKAKWASVAMSHKKEISITQKCGFVSPQLAVHLLSERLGTNSIVTTEVGQNQIWAANNFKIKKAGQFITSGGLGTMGYGLPAAIGSKLAAPDSTVVVISGDGSFQMNLQELATMVQWGIDVKILLLRNNVLGLVRELQQKKHKSNYFAVNLDGSPDFIKLAAAYGIQGERICENSQIEAAIDRMINSKASYIVELRIDPEENSV